MFVFIETPFSELVGVILMAGNLTRSSACRRGTTPGTLRTRLGGEIGAATDDCQEGDTGGDSPQERHLVESFLHEYPSW